MRTARGGAWLLLLSFLSVAVWQLERTPKQHRGPELIAAEYGFFLAAALFGVFLVECFGNDLARATDRLKPWVFVASGLLLLAAIAPLGMHQFGGFDHSTLILSGWVVRSGLVPFRDVPCTLPPLFVMGSAAAMSLFGVHWWAFVAIATIFAGVTFVWLTRQLIAIGLPLPLATGLACVAEISTIMVGAFWWYNPISSIAVILIFASSLASLRNDGGWWPSVSVAGSLCLLLLAKPNTWTAGACVAPLLLAATSQARRRAAVAIFAGVTTAVLLCLAYGFSPTDVLRAYHDVAASRGTPFSLVVFTDYRPVERGCLLAIIFVVAGFFLALFVQARAECRIFWREYTCCAAAGLTSLWMTFTDYELKTSDLAPLVLVIVVLAFQPWSRRRFAIAAKHAVTALLLGTVVASAYWSTTRFRVRGIGEGTFFQYPGDIKTANGFFAGVWSGPRLVRVVQQTQEALRDHPGKVFFGPRMEFLYAVYDRPPARGLPLFWHPGSAYPWAETPAIVDAFFANRFDTLVFLKDDFTRMPVVLLVGIFQSYEHVGNYQELTVFRLRPSASAAVRR